MSGDRSTTLRQLSSLLGASGVALGAFGAHALKNRLSQKAGSIDNWRTVIYQLVHSVAYINLSIQWHYFRFQPSKTIERACIILSSHHRGLEEK